MSVFNVRIYGLLIDEKLGLLLSDEKIRGMDITKFPGGGLEFGEGTRDCLAREFREELNLEIEVVDHFYTTDFFQLSAFNPGHQIISIYYTVKAIAPYTFPYSEKPFDFNAEQLEMYEQTGETETARFVSMDSLTPQHLTLPIDQLVVKQLLAKKHAL